MKRSLLIISTLFLYFVLTGEISPVSGKMNPPQNKDSDSVVTLKKALVAFQIDMDSVVVRKAIDALFFHNNAYLFCDTAYFIDNEYIDAIGNVKIIQEGNTLYSDKIHYIVPQDVAQVRGRIVKLIDKDSNILMTNYLDYNTKDSIATFFEGGSMKDKDGNVIEGETGSYDTKTKIFSFHNSVQMFSDTLFFISDYIRYEADTDIAYFGVNTHGWHGKNFLSANGGRYERANEFVNFIKNVYVESEDQEVFCDTLDYYQNTGDIDLFGNIQVRDSTENMIILGGKLEYTKDPQEVLVTRKPAIVYYTTTESGPDSLFAAADTLNLFSKRMYELESGYIAGALARRRLAMLDPVADYRRIKESESISLQKGEKELPAKELSGKEASGEGLSGKEISGKELPGMELPEMQFGNKGGADITNIWPISADTLKLTSADSLKLLSADSLKLLSADSLFPPADSISIPEALSTSTSTEPKDTTKIEFLYAYHDVRIYREDMQIICDSMIYTGLDSIARLFGDPILWNNIKNQLTSDSMQMVAQDKRFIKGNMISNAMIITDEGDGKYNQIRGAEMTGFFNENNEIYRYDVLGGASTILYIVEDGRISSMNNAEAKMMSVLLENQEVIRASYFDAIKNNLKAIGQVTTDEMLFKSFKWMPEKRPSSRFDVTPKAIRPSGRSSAPVDLFPDFAETKRYFPGYIEGIFREIAVRDSINRVRDEERRLRELAMQADSLVVEEMIDSLEIIISDSLDIIAAREMEHLEEISEQIIEAGGSATERYSSLEQQYEQFMSVDKSQMTKSERKEWRRERRSLRKELKAARKEMKREKKRESRKSDEV